LPNFVFLIFVIEFTIELYISNFYLIAALIPLDLSRFSFYHLLKPTEAISMHADNGIVRVPQENQANNLKFKVRLLHK